MKWRCPQCGKPHERNDPPCDNCGHHKFERAVVPTASEQETSEQLIWVCSECGRQHMRNNPPCSRCGNVNLEKKTVGYADIEAETGGRSYLDLAGRQELAAAGLLLLFIAVGALAVTGIISIPGITPQGPPTVADVPGEGSTYEGIDLGAVESAVFAAVNGDRAESLARSEGLDGMAAYVTQLTVKSFYTDASVSVTRDDLDRFDTRCASGTYNFAAITGSTFLSSGDDPETIADGLTLEPQQDAPPLDAESLGRIGLDAHVGPDGRLFVVAAYC